MGKIPDTCHQSPMQSETQPKSNYKARGFNGANAVVQEELEQANDDLINMTTAAAEEKDVTKMQSNTIVENMKTIADLMPQIKCKD